MGEYIHYFGLYNQYLNKHLLNFRRVIKFNNSCITQIKNHILIMHFLIQRSDIR